MPVVAVAAFFAIALPYPFVDGIRFDVAMFEDLSLAGFFGDWSDAFRYFLATVNALVPATICLLVGRTGENPTLVVAPAALVAGTVVTVLGCVVLVPMALMIFFVLGAIFALFFSGPF